MSVDGVDVLFRQICHDLRPIRDGLITLGAFYAVKCTLKAVVVVSRAAAIYVVPRVWPETNWKRRYGAWAGMYVRTPGICYTNINKELPRAFWF